MRISDWSSDVCSSDLSPEAPPPVTPIAIQPMTAKSARHPVAPVLAPVPAVAPDALELAYEAIDWTPAEAGGLTDAVYEHYALQSLHLPDAHQPPPPLIQSSPMASGAPPSPPSTHQ